MKNKKETEKEKILWWKEPPQVLETKFGRAKIDTQGYYRITTRKEGHKNQLLHRLIFEDFWRCQIPEGFHVHHINGNKLDNRVCNLKLLRASEHNRKHRKEYFEDPENRRKLSEACKKYFEDPENRRKQSEARKGSKLSLDTRKKISKARKKYFEDPENRRKQSEALKKYFEDPENRRKQSDAMKGRKLSLETRKKMSKSQKERWKKEKEKREKNQTKIEQF